MRFVVCKNIFIHIGYSVIIKKHLSAPLFSIFESIQYIYHFLLSVKGKGKKRKE